MDKVQLLLILNRVLELYSAEFDDMSEYAELENDKYLLEQGFTFDKLSEEIQSLQQQGELK